MYVWDAVPSTITGPVHRSARAHINLRHPHTHVRAVQEYLNWYETRKDMTFAPDAPVIGLVLQRSHLVTGDAGHYEGVVMEVGQG